VNPVSVCVTVTDTPGTRHHFRPGPCPSLSSGLRPGGRSQKEIHSNEGDNTRDVRHRFLLAVSEVRPNATPAACSPQTFFCASDGDHLDFPFADTIAKTWTVIDLDAVDSGRTRVTVKMLGYTSDSDSQKMRAFFEVGNKTTLDALAKRFAAR
jgi:hypothetical protein